MNRQSQRQGKTNSNRQTERKRRKVGERMTEIQKRCCVRLRFGRDLI